MRATPVLVAALALTLAAVPVPVAAHVNHVSADPQVSPDGTLVAETAFIATDGYLAVHRDDGGEVGDAIGHTTLSSDDLQTDVAVTVDPAVWANWSTDEVWLVLHTSDGDGRFEPASDDPVLETFGASAGTRVTVTRGDRALVTVEAFAPQRLNASHTSVRVRNATLPSDGAVVVRAQESGQVLGRTTLSAGGHTNVSVALDEAYLEANEQFAVEAVLVDGDRSPVTAGDSPVATTFGVRYRSEGGTPTPAVVQTATATAANAGDSETNSTDSGTGTDGSTTGVTGPGFGFLAALVALTLVALFASRGL
jgi:hypothetical protein